MFIAVDRSVRLLQLRLVIQLHQLMPSAVIPAGASSSPLYAMPTTMPMTMLSSSSTSWVSLPCSARLGGAVTLLM